MATRRRISLRNPRPILRASRSAAIAIVASDLRPILRAAMRSGAFGAAIETTIGGVEAAFGVWDGHSVEAAARHVGRKAAGGFIVGTAASVSAAAVGAVIGPGIPALFGGLIGATIVAKLVGRAMGPSPIEGSPKKRK